MSVFEIHKGDCVGVMRGMQDASVDSVVCDPPYEIGFMGRTWDATGIAYNVDMWREVLRVRKPGGHLLAFSSARTYHRVACAVEDAGFEFRTQIMWVYGSGMPKGKKLTGEWDGWATELKPSHEPIVVARKPLEGTVEGNVRAHRTGALNVAGCMIPCVDDADAKMFADNHAVTERLPADYAGRKLGLHDGGWKQRVGPAEVPGGRWPANLIHDGSPEVLAAFPVAGGQQGRTGTRTQGAVYSAVTGGESGVPPRAGSGSAARFFYSAKASRKDRDEGLNGFEVKRCGGMSATADGSILTGSGNPRTTARANTHNTVKPTELMRYLCRLVTPPGGVVLDHFAGSGSTGKGAILEGFRFVGIERDEGADGAPLGYVDIARARCAWAAEQAVADLM